MIPEFKPFPKISRLSRDIVITEKIDGTNACICITEDSQFLIGSRTGWITPEKDNYGFAAWANKNKTSLLSLGIGTHFGEWWGHKIQRGYGIASRKFSLFNVERWYMFGEEPNGRELVPDCVSIVPVLYRGIFNTDEIQLALDNLKEKGSIASRGFMNPEGIVVYHTAAKAAFKKTILKDDEWKGKL